MNPFLPIAASSSYEASAIQEHIHHAAGLDKFFGYIATTAARFREYSSAKLGARATRCSNARSSSPSRGLREGEDAAENSSRRRALRLVSGLWDLLGFGLLLTWRVLHNWASKGDGFLEAEGLKTLNGCREQVQVVAAKHGGKTAQSCQQGRGEAIRGHSNGPPRRAAPERTGDDMVFAFRPIGLQAALKDEVHCMI